METLWKDLAQNAGFVAMSLAIIAVIAVLAWLLERLLPEKRTVTPARRITLVGICAAIAAVLHILDFPLVFLALSRSTPLSRSIIST